MPSSPAITQAARIDKTRPHKLAMPLEENAEQSPVLVYQYLDDGELVEVPNNPGNQTPGVLAHDIRIQEAHFLRMAQEALTAKGHPDWQRQFEHDNSMRHAQEMADRAQVYDELEQWPALARPGEPRPHSGSTGGVPGHQTRTRRHARRDLQPRLMQGVGDHRATG